MGCKGTAVVLKSSPLPGQRQNAATDVGSEECQMKLEVEFCGISDPYVLYVECVLCPAVGGLRFS